MLFRSSGGMISLTNYARAVVPSNFVLNLPVPEAKKLGESSSDVKEVASKEAPKEDVPQGPLVIDVRTQEEFAYGAFTGAINIPLDELQQHAPKLSNAKERPIILYCASGARSAYAVQILKAHGFTNLENGGGLSRMMAKQRR